jgi:hypothetical protein
MSERGGMGEKGRLRLLSFARFELAQADIRAVSYGETSAEVAGIGASASRPTF